MIEFIVGLGCGMFLGILLMALMVAASRGEKNEG